MYWRSLVWCGLVLLAAGCAEQSPPVEAVDHLRVKLLTTSTVSGRWECAAESGLGLIAAELDAEIDRIRLGESRQPLFESLESAPDVAFCVGLGLESEVLNFSQDYPNTKFLVIPSKAAAGNVKGLFFRTDGAGYLAGVLASLISDGPSVGVIRGPGMAWVEFLETGFVNGIRSRIPKVEVIVGEGERAPWAMVERGAQVALYASDVVDDGVLASAHDAGLKVIAVDPDLMSREPDVVVAAVNVDVAAAMLECVRHISEGEIPDGSFVFNLGSGCITLELNRGIREMVDPRIDAELNAARREVVTGIMELEQLGI